MDYIDSFWNYIVAHQGETFFTKKGLPFSYTVKGGEVFIDRKKKSITRNTAVYAVKKAVETPDVKGPKALGVFGAPYVWMLIEAWRASEPETT